MQLLLVSLPSRFSSSRKLQEKGLVATGPFSVPMWSRWPTWPTWPSANSSFWWDVGWRSSNSPLSTSALLLIKICPVLIIGSSFQGNVCFTMHRIAEERISPLDLIMRNDLEEADIINHAQMEGTTTSLESVKLCLYCWVTIATNINVYKTHLEIYVREILISEFFRRIICRIWA